MSILSPFEEKLQTIAENVQKVYEAGKQAQYDEFWDDFQDNGNRRSYNYAFAGDGWTMDMFAPKYNLIVDRGTGLFQEYGSYLGSSKYIYSLTERLQELGISINTENCTVCGNMFNYANFTQLPELDLRKGGSLGYTFANMSRCHTIDKLKVSANNTFSNTFANTKALKNFTIEGTIANALDMKSCTLLSKASIISIINALSTTTSGLTVTLSKTAVNNAFGVMGEHSAEWMDLRDTKKNWTISLA